MAFRSCLFCVLVASTAIHSQTPVAQNEETSTITNTTTPLPSTTTLTPIPSEQLLVQLNFELKEEHLRGILNYLLMEDRTRYPINPEHLFQLTNLREMTLDDSLTFLKEAFNLEKEQVFTVNALEALFTSFNIVFSDFYKTLSEKFNVNQQETEAIFGIDSNKLLGAMIRPNLNVYDVLREGVFSAENAETARSLIGVTWDEIFTAAREYVLDKLRVYNIEEFMSILTAKGWNARVHNKVWDGLHITSEKVYSIDIFKSLLEDINTSLNNRTILGVFVQGSSLVIHQSLYESIDRRILGSPVKILANGIEVEQAPSKVGDRIYELKLRNGTLNSIGITKMYKSFKDCYYMVMLNNVAQVAPMQVERLEGRKTGTVFFQLGAPLICEQELYGLAASETEELIVFDRFYTKFDEEYNSAGAVSLSYVVLVVCAIIGFSGVLSEL